MYKITTNGFGKLLDIGTRRILLNDETSTEDLAIACDGFLVVKVEATEPETDKKTKK